MPPLHFPLRWESTGDQWWYASPIDFAAANGHYDLVKHLLNFDPNLLIKLTSLRRIRRLETVWDDQEQFHHVSRHRSEVARRLLHDCEPKPGKSQSQSQSQNSLIRAGYGGWLLYTAASAGDIDFVKELLKRDPLLVFGEGEYGVTDMLYAAARGKSCEVFRVLFDFDFSVWSTGGEVGSVFKWEMMNRGVHGAARGGNLVILKELIGECGDVLMYRDFQGSTLLHSASGRGQTEVVKYLIESYDIIGSTDAHGNTALHVAAYSGHLPVVEILIASSPSSIAVHNNNGDTFLHAAIAGFRTPGFRRVDQQIELMKQLVSGNLVNIETIVNLTNNDGRTALHMAVIESIHTDLVDLLMSIRGIELNIRDVDGMTPLDHLKQNPRSASSEILIKRLISAGGISDYRDYMTRSALASHLKTIGIGDSPGTSFRIPDGEIIFYTNVKNEIKNVSYSGEIGQYYSPARSSSGLRSRTSAVRRLKLLFGLGREKEPEPEHDRESLDSYENGNLKYRYSPVPLRERFSKSSNPNNKRVFVPSPLAKKNFSTGLTHGVIQIREPHSPSSPFSGSCWSSPVSIEDRDGDKLKEFSYSGKVKHLRTFSNPWVKGLKTKTHTRQSSMSKILMNQVFCFGTQGLAVEEPVRCGLRT